MQNKWLWKQQATCSPVKDALVSQAHEPDLVQCIRSVADELPQEDLFIAVEGVDDQAQQLVNLGLLGDSKAQVG